MSTPDHPDGPTDENQENDNGGVLEVTFHYLDCLESDEHVGVAFRRTRDGDIIPESMTPLRAPQEAIVDRTFAAAAHATAASGRRRHRLPPVRPPRPPRPIFDWESLVGMSPAQRAVEEAERERYAAEISLPRNLDTEPDQALWPTGWESHHDYFLWCCRGTVEVITDHMQAVFVFDPPIEETFVAARLGGVNAYKQITFLHKYLPGEAHSLQRAEARGVLYEADISNPDVRWGTQQLDIKQPNPGDEEYIEPVLPCWAPPNWTRADDAFVALYLGDHPTVFQREYGWAGHKAPSLEFIRIRMAQIPHLNLSWRELHDAKRRSEIDLGIEDLPYVGFF
ncbi:uncharacterized protein BJX67DRAFT_208892 [Aspergillus lucknowensis]|uniref:Uncharacterized protein n=1 Tax=Aspergillus lucknowensis TaxID=176173 RepID=A0ABR4LKI7_9EURO